MRERAAGMEVLRCSYMQVISRGGDDATQRGILKKKKQDRRNGDKSLYLAPT